MGATSFSINAPPPLAAICLPDMNNKSSVLTPTGHPTRTLADAHFANAALARLRAGRLPLWLKVAYTAFMAVLIPVYWSHYGPTNFLYFCDVALLLTLAAVWLESPLLASIPAVGILMPQMFWCLDFAAHLVGLNLTGVTNYMFDGQRPLFLRGLSLFHGWLPFMLIFLVARLGYDRRAGKAWLLTAWALMLICFFLLPMPGSLPAGSISPVNVNYVYGMSDAAPQSWMPTWAWLAVLMTGLPLLAWLPTHFVLKKFCRPASGLA